MNLEELELIYGKMVEDEFTGITFGSSTGLKVLGVLPKHSYDHPPYHVIECNICKQDPELYGEGLFPTNIRISLKRGYNPCGCKKQYSFNKQQHEIIITRKCERSDIVFKGWIEPIPKAKFNKTSKISVLVNGTEITYTLDSFYKKNFDCDISDMHQHHQAYINIAVNELTEEWVGLKYGISKDYTKRVYSQNRRSCYKVINYGVWEFVDKLSALRAEQKCRLMYGTKILAKREFPDGYTETTNILNLVNIKRIYEECGGILLND